MRGDWWPCLLSKGHEGLLDGSHHRLGNIYHVTLKTSFHAAGTNGTADEAGSGGRGVGTSATVDAALSGAGKGAFNLAGAVSIAEATKGLHEAVGLGAGSRVGLLYSNSSSRVNTAGTNGTADEAGSGGRGAGTSATVDAALSGAGKGAFDLAGAVSIAEATKRLQKAFALGTGSRVFLGTLDAQILNTSEAATIDSTGYKAAGGGRGRRSSACLGTGSGGAGKGAFNLGGAISIAKAGNGITEADILGA